MHVRCTIVRGAVQKTSKFESSWIRFSLSI
jgi:hypothetical protein